MVGLVLWRLYLGKGLGRYHQWTAQLTNTQKTRMENPARQEWEWNGCDGVWSIRAVLRTNVNQPNKLWGFKIPTINITLCSSTFGSNTLSLIPHYSKQWTLRTSTSKRATFSVHRKYRHHQHHNSHHHHHLDIGTTWTILQRRNC